MEWSEWNVNGVMAFSRVRTAQLAEGAERPHGHGRYEHLQGRAPVAEGTVWSQIVIVSRLVFDYDEDLLERVEDLASEQLVPKPPQ